VLRIRDILVSIRIQILASEIIDPAPDPANFVIDLQDANKKLIFPNFSAYYGTFLKVHLHHFSKIKVIKKSQNRRNQGVFYYFCLMIEGSGSVPLTNGSGSRRPKNIRLLWIRIRYTAKYSE
jgi:hypothetical protein